MRESPGGETLFLVALTGYGGLQDRERALAAGFDVHLTKPGTEAALSAVLARARASPSV